MCAIIDNNVRHEVFGTDDVRTAAGRFLLEWIESGKGKLVIGGKLRQELSDYGRFLEWLPQARRAGHVILVGDDAVDAETTALQARNVCRSNDAHVLALAQVSGARLLFTNDQDLNKDFKNSRILGGVRGRVYTTLQRQDVRKSHRNLLNRTDLCSL